MNLKELPFRLILSVVAGIFTATALSMLTEELLHKFAGFPAINEPKFDKQVLLVSLILHSVYAVAGAVITAHIAREKARKATFILGTKEAIMWLLGTLLLWHHAAPWYNITKAVLGIPLALLGGWIYATISKKRKIEALKRSEIAR